MKRTKEKTERELENEERQAMFAHEISDAMKSQGWGDYLVYYYHDDIRPLGSKEPQEKYRFWGLVCRNAVVWCCERVIAHDIIKYRA